LPAGLVRNRLAAGGRRIRTISTACGARRPRMVGSRRTKLIGASMGSPAAPCRSPANRSGTPKLSSSGPGTDGSNPSPSTGEVVSRGISPVLVTLRWREPDSTHRSRVRKVAPSRSATRADVTEARRDAAARPGAASRIPSGITRRRGSVSAQPVETGCRNWARLPSPPGESRQTAPYPGRDRARGGDLPRHHIPSQQDPVTNWSEYDAGLHQRGSLTVWFSEEAIAA
jgi:hypothetical protein